jgi:hypothetical protein
MESKKRQSVISNKPPQINSNIQYTHTYRFTSSNATRTALTPNSLLCAAGSMGVVSNTTVISYLQSVRIKRITIRAPPPSQGSIATTSVEWVGIANQSSNKEVSDTSNSVTTPATIKSIPPRQSLAAFWQQPSSTSLCYLIAPPGSIIDILLDLIFQDDDSTNASSSVATAVVGNVYYLSADPNTTHYYTPISLTTTT